MAYESSAGGDGNFDAPTILAIEAAIEATVPQRFDLRHTRLFEFIRHLHAIDGVADAPVAALRPFVRRWHERALPFIRVVRDFDDEWFDFIESWDKVRFPKGKGIYMAAIIERAKSAEPPACAANYENPKLRFLVAWCRDLAQAAGGEFFLSSYDVAAELDIQPRRAWRWLMGLCSTGVIERVRSGNRKKANTYRYTGGD